VQFSASAVKLEAFFKEASRLSLQESRSASKLLAFSSTFKLWFEAASRWAVQFSASAVKLEAFFKEALRLSLQESRSASKLLAFSSTFELRFEAASRWAVQLLASAVKLEAFFVVCSSFLHLFNFKTAWFDSPLADLSSAYILKGHCQASRKEHFSILFCICSKACTAHIILQKKCHCVDFNEALSATVTFVFNCPNTTCTRLPDLAKVWQCVAGGPGGWAKRGAQCGDTSLGSSRWQISDPGRSIWCLPRASREFPRQRRVVQLRLLLPKNCLARTA